MAKKRVIVLYNFKQGADSSLKEAVRKLVIEDFIPAEKEAPGLISIEFIEKFTDPIPHEPNNQASAFGFVELWENAESNNDWWAGNIFEPKSERMKAVMEKFGALLGSPGGELVEFLDCHYTVRD